MMTGWLLLPSVLALISQGNACGSRESVLVLVSKKPVRLKDPREESPPIGPDSNASRSGNGRDNRGQWVGYGSAAPVEDCDKPKECVDQFKWWDGTIVKGCINPWEEFGELPWCAMRLTAFGQPLLGNSIHCICGEDRNECALAVGCRKQFVYSDGKVYKGCANPENDTGGPWCSTMNDEKGVHVKGEFIYCECGDAAQIHPWMQSSLNLHNKYRSQHGSPPLEFSDDLNRHAANWAATLLAQGRRSGGDHPGRRSATSNLTASNYPGIGQNIKIVMGDLQKCNELFVNQAIDEWYKEGAVYDYSNPQADQQKTIEFTQLIWKNTKTFGIGKAGDGKECIIVADYEPQGNLPYQFKDNVLPPAGGVPTSPHTNESSTGAPRTEEWRQAALELHNKYRAEHQAPPLQLVEELNAEATQWAQHLIQLPGTWMNNEHSNKPGLGENTYGLGDMKCGNEIAVVGTKSWYKEGERYNYTDPPPATSWATAGHFSALVWQSTTQVGFGCAEDATGSILVANYKPPGNVPFKQESYRQNVLPTVTPTTPPPPLSPPPTTRGPEPPTRGPSPTISGASPESTTGVPRTEDWRQAALEAHNRFRALHHAPPLELDESLNAEGTQWAQHLISKFGCCEMEHSQKDLGENIFAMSGGVKCGKDVGVSATNMWYNELKEKGYNFDNPPPVTDWYKTGHFTQVVWKETIKMGIGCADDENGYFVVANYKPGGNTQSQEEFRKNVLPK